jgi:hypothetical protein
MYEFWWTWFLIVFFIGVLWKICLISCYRCNRSVNTETLIHHEFIPSQSYPPSYRFEDNLPSDMYRPDSHFDHRIPHYTPEEQVIYRSVVSEEPLSQWGPVLSIQGGSPDAIASGGGPFVIEVPSERHEEQAPPAYSDLFKGDYPRGGLN